MKKGFTLAEVLITLAIIGIVAAITIPSLMADVNQKAFDNQRKTLHSRLANALTAMDKLSGYGVYDDTDAEDIKDTAAESFIVDGLSKVYKIRNTCSVDKMEKCGVSDSFTTVEGNTATMPKKLSEAIGGRTFDVDTNAIAFETNNGESIVALYNPKCMNKSVPTATSTDYIPDKVCVNFIYDLNGPKAPNMMGKDMGFITAFYKEEPIVVAPTADEKSVLSGNSYTSLTAADACEAIGSDYRLPTTEELVAFACNESKYLDIKSTGGAYFWSSDITTAGGANGGKAVTVHIPDSFAYVWTRERTATGRVLCVKR